MKRWACALFVFGLAPGLCAAADARLDRYDGAFRKWGRWHFGYEVDWRWFKAQGMAESGLRADVCSRAGACGVMQFMPGTALGMGLQDRFQARASIRAGVAYDKQLWRMWSAPRPSMDRLAFTFASYNAGAGHVLRWQREALKAGEPSNLWSSIARRAWREPRNYVQRIARWFSRWCTGAACVPRVPHPQREPQP